VRTVKRRPATRDWFFKGHGLGNDYFVLKRGALSFRLTPSSVRLLCDRHLGVGSDGILLHVPSRKADAGLRIFNPDGSEAQKSGNGARIFALYLRRYGLPGRNSYSIETPGGTVHAAFRGGAITVDMGKATFRSDTLPMRGPSRQAIRQKIRVAGRTLEFTGVSVGNPHAVFFFRGNPDPALLRKLGPAIERHRLFPERTNVQFARAVSRNTARALIWERGAGETQASGSSSCAVAAAGRRLGHFGKQVRVMMPGGTLTIGVADNWQITMTGPAEEVVTGTLSPDILKHLTR